LQISEAHVGLGSLLGPLGLFMNLKGIHDYITAGNEAERAKREAEYRAAEQSLIDSGFDPNQTYSQDVVQAALDAAPEFAGLPGMDAATLSRDLVGNTINRYLQDPSAYSTVTGANQLAATPNPVDYGRDVVDTIGDIFNDPSSLVGVILGPGGVTGNVVWGDKEQPVNPKARPAVYTGKIGDKVYTGTSTGSPTLDAAIRRVLGQTEGGETTSMDVIIEGVQNQTGLPVADVARILKDVFKDSGASLPSPTSTPTGGAGSTASTTPTGGGQTTDQQDKVTVGADKDVFDKVMQILKGKKTDKEIRDAAEAAGVTPEEIAKATGISQDEVDRRWEGAGGPFDTSGNDVLDTTTGGTVLDTTTGGTVLDTTTGGSVLDTTTGGSVLDTTVPPGQGPSVLEPENRPVLDVAQPSGGDSGSGGGGFNLDDLLSMQPQYRTVTAESGPLADINYLYDIGGESIFAPNVEASDEEDKNLARIRSLGGVPYYAQGGQVDVVELALQLLRG